MSFFSELRRRNVTRVAIGYLAVAWLLIQIGDVMFPALGTPHWSLRLLIGLLALGFPIALVLSWAFKITPDGIERETSESSAPATDKGSRRRGDLIIVGVLAAAVVFLLVDNYLWDDTVPAQEFGRGEVEAVAVLPLQLLNNDADEEYLAEQI